MTIRHGSYGIILTPFSGKWSVPLRRNDGGMLSIPGGGRKPHESPIGCVRREGIEENGIYFDDMTYIGEFVDKDEKENKLYVCAMYLSAYPHHSMQALANCGPTNSAEWVFVNCDKIAMRNDIYPWVKKALMSGPVGDITSRLAARGRVPYGRIDPYIMISMDFESYTYILHPSISTYCVEFKIMGTTEEIMSCGEWETGIQNFKDSITGKWSMLKALDRMLIMPDKRILDIVPQGLSSSEKISHLMKHFRKFPTQWVSTPVVCSKLMYI
jgi:8-oxo-dGTP pyrophosphatase MutT (NUDIX family)